MKAARHKLLIVMGTRPEVIKLAPIVKLAKKRAETFECLVVTTSQHRQMLDQMLETFGLEVDVDLDIMRHDQSLADVTQAALDGLYPLIGQMKPDWVIVQGDTTTTLMGAMAAFYHQVRVAHVEAGLRTFDKYQPFPEEINRRLTTQMASLHFAPTEQARQHLLAESIDERSILVTGNTCIDALFHTLGQENLQALPPRQTHEILVTAHRRENHGEPLEKICRALLRILDAHPTASVTYPVHLSPRVRSTVFDLLNDHPRIKLLEPLEYEEFVVAMHGAHIILTDSGGVQEEAPALGKPVLVLRETTERPEGVEAGTLKLVGTNEDRIVSATEELLTDPEAYARMATSKNPYGDGRAAERILDFIAGGDGAWLREQLQSQPKRAANHSVPDGWKN